MSELQNTLDLLNSLSEKGYGQDDPEIDISSMLEWVKSRNIPRIYSQLETGDTFTTEFTKSNIYVKLEDGTAANTKPRKSGEIRSFNFNDTVLIQSGGYDHDRAVENELTNGQNGILSTSGGGFFFIPDDNQPLIISPETNSHFSNGTFELEIGNTEGFDSWLINVKTVKGDTTVLNLQPSSLTTRTVTGLNFNAEKFYLLLQGYVDGFPTGQQRLSPIIINDDWVDPNEGGN